MKPPLRAIHIMVVRARDLDFRLIRIGAPHAHDDLGGAAYFLGGFGFQTLQSFAAGLFGQLRIAWLGRI
jgi:hypothetical protein